jgi:hypothetical protein
MMVNKQLQRISKVPLVSGEETKWVVAFGSEHVVLYVDSTEAVATDTSPLKRRRARAIVIGEELSSDPFLGLKELYEAATRIKIDEEEEVDVDEAEQLNFSVVSATFKLVT